METQVITMIISKAIHVNLIASLIIYLILNIFLFLQVIFLTSKIVRSQFAIVQGFEQLNNNNILK